MKDTEFQKQFLTVARNIPDRDQVPYAFEQRILARVKSVPFYDPITAWGQMLWRAVVPCVAITCLAGFIAAGLEADAPDLEAALTPATALDDSW